MPEKFYLDDEKGSHECKILTTLYSEQKDKYYLVYTIENQEDVYVSSFDPDIEDEEFELLDVVDQEELEEVTALYEREIE